MTVAEIDTKRRAKAAEPPEAPTHTSLWDAFAAAQIAFKPLVKDADGQRGKYAPLDSVLDNVRPVLNEHGITLTQPTTVEGDTVLVRTVLVHIPTGETHECLYPAGAITLAHQQLGAGVTYARRYSLLSLLGVFPSNEDDDGEKAGAAGGTRPIERRTNVVTNPATGKKIDTENARNQRPEWAKFTDRVQGYIDARDADGLKQWFVSDKTAAYVAGWVFKDEAHEHFEKALDEIAAREAAQ